MNKRHIRYLFLVLVVAGFPAHAAFSQVSWTDADCYYNGTVVNGYASVSVGYEMGYYYDTSIALVMYDPYNNIVAAETNYTNGYSHAHDDVDFAPTWSGSYTIRVYVDVQIYYSDYCGWIDYWGFSHVYQQPVTAWDYYELQGSDPEYCWTYCCMSLLELLADDQVPCPDISIAAYSPDPYPLDIENLTADTKTALTCLKNAVEKVGGTLPVTSGYRPQAYQDHLIDVWDKYQMVKNWPAGYCTSVRQPIQTEWNRHGLVTRPAAESDHTNGTAFDSTWSLPPGQNIDTLAQGCSLSRPDPSGDWVHFKR